MIGEKDAVSCDPWLTVVMPIHNGSRYLDETMRSLAAEPCDGIEVIVIDSSDNDECENILKGYYQYINIVYLFRKEIVSWTEKTNLAVGMASAPYVSMLHQDDLWLPGRVNIFRKSIHSRPSASFFLSPAYIIGEDGKRLGIWRCPLSETNVWRGNGLMERLLVQNFIAIPSPIIRKSAWDAVQGLDEKLWYTADWDMYLKLARNEEFFYIDIPSTCFRIHDQSLTVTGSKNVSDFRSQIHSVIERHLPFISLDRRQSVEKIAKASMAINVALAAALAGKWRIAVANIVEVFYLNFGEISSLFKYSRIFERLIPRLRLKFRRNYL